MSEMLEVAIVGSGPAGLGAATNAAKHGLSHVLFEKSEVGNTVYCYQLKKYVMAEPSKLPLRSLAPFEAGSREEVLERWNRAIVELRVNLCKAEVSAIRRLEVGFEITHSKGKTLAKNVVLAIGMQGSPRRLEVPGAEQAHVSYTLSDPDAFNDQDILVIGAGDAAIENALALVDRNRVSLLNRSADFPLAKDANVGLILKAIDTGRLKCLYNSNIQQVNKDSVVLGTPEGELTIKCTQIIARIGAIMPRKFLESCGITFSSQETNATPIINQRYESTVPGLFILGALIGYPLIKQALNQGFEVIEHILGNDVLPADQVLIDERLSMLPGGTAANYQSIRSTLSLCQDLSEPQYRELIIDSSIHVTSPGQVLFNYNDYTDSCFSLVSGEVQIELESGLKISVAPGEYFGEMSLLSGRRRTGTARTTQSSVLLETPRKQMLKLISQVPSVRLAINRKFLLNALMTSIFPDVEVNFIHRLADKASFKAFKKGELIFKEGDIGDALYVIRKGSAKISRRDATGLELVQSYVAAGNFVGEMALLEFADVARSATVSAAVPCETIVISKGDFLELLAASPAAKRRITQLAESRKVENLTEDRSTESSALLDFILSQGISDAENVLLIDSNLCIGCDNCEAACAATHGGWSRLDRSGGKSFASIQVPISCRHCENPLCMLDCPPDALTRRPNGEVVIRDSCIGCGNCIRNCPYGVIQMVYDKPDEGFSLLRMLGLAKSTMSKKGPGKAGKCDMCSDLSGGPACVRACPTGAAMRVNPKVFVKMTKAREGRG